LAKHPQDIVAFTVEQLGVTSTTVRRHPGHLIKRGEQVGR
jgi:hypothetical protein